MDNLVLPVFVGIADSSNIEMQANHINSVSVSILPGPITISDMSMHKSHFMYPAFTQKCLWVFLVSHEFLQNTADKKWRIKIDLEESDDRWFVDFDCKTVKEIDAGKSIEFSYKTAQELPIQYLVVQFNDVLITKPGRYNISFCVEGEAVGHHIGTAHFHYIQQDITDDEIHALRANPKAKLRARIDIGCKHCTSKLGVYCSLDRSQKIEKREQLIWYRELPNNFVCACGKTNMPLHRLKNGMLRLLVNEINGVRYSNLYRLADIEGVVKKFHRILSQEYEEPVQKFIEANLLILAHFHASKIFIKPSILGMHYADFALGSGPIEMFTKQEIGDSILSVTAGGMNEWIVLAERPAMGEA